MKPVFEYLDYRVYMKDAFDERKAHSPLYSYRALAELLGLDTSNIFRILHQEAHLPTRCHPKAVEFLGITGRSAEYFLLLIAYARERRSKARTEILEKALSLRDVATRNLEENELAYFRDWWVVAIRSLLEVMDGNAVPSEISRRLVPKVPEDEVSKALKLLQELGLVKKAASDRLILADAHLTSGGHKKTQAVRHFQRQVLSLAAESLERFPREDRDVSSLTFAVDAQAFIEIREILRECRREIQTRIEESKKPSQVFQLAMALFPLSSHPVKTP